MIDQTWAEAADRLDVLQQRAEVNRRELEQRTEANRRAWEAYLASTEAVCAALRAQAWRFRKGV